MKSIQEDVENIFEIIKLSKIPKTLFKDMVFIVIKVAYETEVFENTSNIEIAYQVAY